jgi:hypothetical protein
VRKGGGKAKGSAFERKICVMLSLKVSNGKDDSIFWRSAMSGGRATVREKKYKKNDTSLGHVSGDICAVHRKGFKFVEKNFVECKHYRNLQIEGFLFRKSGTLYGFWKVARKKAKLYGKRPWLIFKQNNLPVMVMVTVKGALDLNVPVERALVNCPSIKYPTSKGALIYNFDTFLKYASL